MRRLRVFKRGSKLFLHALAPANGGFWAGVGPFRTIDVDSPDSFLGDVLLEVLAGSHLGARGSDDLLAHRGELVAMTRAKNWRSFTSGADALEIHVDGDNVRFVRCDRRRFEADGELLLAVSSALGSDLGAGLRQALRDLRPPRRRRRR